MKESMLKKLKVKGFMEEYLPILDNAIYLKCNIKLNNLEAVIPELELICDCYHAMKKEEEEREDRNKSIIGALKGFSQRFRY